MKCFTTLLAPGLFFAVAALAREQVTDQYGTTSTSATTAHGAPTDVDNGAAEAHPTAHNTVPTSSAAAGEGPPGHHGPAKPHIVVIDGTTYKSPEECGSWHPDGWLSSSTSTVASGTVGNPTDTYTDTTAVETTAQFSSSTSQAGANVYPTDGPTSSNSASNSQTAGNGYDTATDDSTSSSSTSASATDQPPYGGAEGSSSSSSTSASQTDNPTAYTTTNVDTTTLQTSTNTAANPPPSGYTGNPSGTATIGPEAPAATATAIIKLYGSSYEEPREIKIPVSSELYIIPEAEIAKAKEMQVVSVNPEDPTVKCQAFNDAAGRKKLGRRTKVGKKTSVMKLGGEKRVRAVTCGADLTTQQIA